MSTISKLHKIKGIHTLEITSKEDAKHLSINLPDESIQFESLAIKKINGEEVEITEGKVHNPMLSTRMLLEKGINDYVGRIEIDTTSGTLAIVGADDYRELTGKKEFSYKLKGTWVSLQVVKELEGGDPVFYLVVNANVVKTKAES